MSWIDLLQWPAMLASVVAAWLVGSARPRAALAAMNLRGAHKADAQADQNEPAPNSST